MWYNSDQRQIKVLCYSEDGKMLINVKFFSSINECYRKMNMNRETVKKYLENGRIYTGNMCKFLYDDFKGENENRTTKSLF